MRAKAGMQAGDIQKEAHLSFYLGMVHENNKSYKEVNLRNFNCLKFIKGHQIL